ncbi:MAG TPA: hypothetical protein VK612_03145 [Pyrinomonadaceae bacterium]|nr:hypothetical protein [Pyrinomonadaceae bacterium]
MFLLAFAESIQLFPDGTLFIHIALILLMIWVLNRTFFRPINRIIESREKNKGGHGSEAEKILSDVSEKEAKLSKSLLAARSEGYDLIERERNTAVELRVKKLADAKAATAQALTDEKQSLAEQTVAARAQIAIDAEALSDQISANVLKA